MFISIVSPSSSSSLFPPPPSSSSFSSSLHSLQVSFSFFVIAQVGIAAFRYKKCTQCLHSNWSLFRPYQIFFPNTYLHWFDKSSMMMMMMMMMMKKKIVVVVVIIIITIKRDRKEERKNLLVQLGRPYPPGIIGEQ